MVLGMERHVGKICESCNQARVAEINRISKHYDDHPDECCCHTFFGRASCKSPIHGDWWRVNGIDDGQRFYFFIRASDRKDAMEIGSEACQSNGEECISVRKAKENEARP
jgi:hypothetical protein